ncbi:uncharacterized protein si:dkey-20d21.12 [Triplophysa rosa]|uniref:Leucine-rich single-pass membrane protein 2 n=1 Tax=Triplophysa rosa TaxID=992332 RepID=A0A9W7TFA1_TRIRA|nr:uncharacterized protein si:dkey-20d21.12 [Triplophysa rosa]KAI7797605.1 hypothetical protein IRJ41_019489 [Triplophysa rosa]
MKSTPSPPPAFVSDRDLTEIELHSVESISDLHRTNTEQHSKGVLPPRPPPPSTNGTLQMQDRIVVYQTGQSAGRPCVSRLKDICTSTRWHYFLACAAIIVFLLTLILIFAFLVHQSNALQTLLEVMKQQQKTFEEISQFLQGPQKLRFNLTVVPDEQRP